MTIGQNSEGSGMSHFEIGLVIMFLNSHINVFKYCDFFNLRFLSFNSKFYLIGIRQFTIF